MIDIKDKVLSLLEGALAPMELADCPRAESERGGNVLILPPGGLGARATVLYEFDEAGCKLCLFVPDGEKGAVAAIMAEVSYFDAEAIPKFVRSVRTAVLGPASPPGEGGG